MRTIFSVNGLVGAKITCGRARRWGLLGWARPVFDVMMDGASTAVDYQLDELLGPDVNHFRFQVELEGVNGSLDDADPKNIKALRALAETYVEKNLGRLEQAVARLAANPPAE